MYSRLPFLAARELPADGASEASGPALEVRLRVAEQEVLVQLVHAARAGRAWRLEARNSQLVELARHQAPPGVARVLAGDLNLAPTSPTFRHLLRAGDLRDSRIGFGRAASWCAAELVPDPALRHWLAGCDASWITIDHVLVGPTVAVLDRRAVDLPGSDHRAAVADLAFGP